MIAVMGAGYVTLPIVWPGIPSIPLVVGVIAFGLVAMSLPYWDDDAPESLMLVALKALARPDRIRKAWDRHKEQLLIHGWWIALPKRAEDPLDGTQIRTEEVLRKMLKSNGGVMTLNGILEFRVLEVVAGLRQVVIIGILPDMPPKRRRQRKKIKLKVPSWGRAPSESYGHVTS
jgi:hypothetical protein